VVGLSSKTLSIRVRTLVSHIFSGTFSEKIRIHACVLCGASKDVHVCVDCVPPSETVEPPSLFFVCVWTRTCVWCECGMCELYVFKLYPIKKMCTIRVRFLYGDYYCELRAEVFLQQD